MCRLRLALRAGDSRCGADDAGSAASARRSSGTAVVTRMRWAKCSRSSALLVCVWTRSSSAQASSGLRSTAWRRLSSLRRCNTAHPTGVEMKSADGDVGVWCNGCKKRSQAGSSEAQGGTAHDCTRRADCRGPARTRPPAHVLPCVGQKRDTRPTPSPPSPPPQPRRRAAYRIASDQ